MCYNFFFLYTRQINLASQVVQKWLNESPVLSDIKSICQSLGFIDSDIISGDLPQEQTSSLREDSLVHMIVDQSTFTIHSSWFSASRVSVISSINVIYFCARKETPGMILQPRFARFSFKFVKLKKHFSIYISR